MTISSLSNFEKFNEIDGRLGVFFNPINIREKMTSSRRVVLVYRARHIVYYKRIEPGSLKIAIESIENTNISKKQENSDLIIDNYGTRYINAIYYGAQLKVTFTVTSTEEDINVEELESYLNINIGNEEINNNMEIEAKWSGGNIFSNIFIPRNPSDLNQACYAIKNFNDEYEETKKISVDIGQTCCPLSPLHSISKDLWTI